MTNNRRLGFKVSDSNLTLDETASLIRSYRKTGTALSRRRVGRKIVAWTPQPGYVYTQVRAISARVNQNYDAWPSSQLKKYHASFVGKPVFVNHTNEDPSTARGVVVAARYVEKSATDKYIECIMETDAKRFPKLGHELRTGGLDSVSMGVEAGFTICSVCKNKAADLHDMCDHIKFHKGEHLKDKTGKKILVYEDCYKLGFFELSYVFDPADETAVVSRVIAAGKKTAEEAYKPIGWDRYAPVYEEGKEWDPKSDGHQDHAPVNTIKRNLDPSVTQAYDNASPEEKAYLDPLDFYSPYKPSKEPYQVREQDRARNRLSWYKPELNWYKKSSSPNHHEDPRDSLPTHTMNEMYDEDFHDSDVKMPKHWIDLMYAFVRKTAADQQGGPTWVPHINKDTGEMYEPPDWNNEVYVHRFQPAFARRDKARAEFPNDPAKWDQPDLWSVGTKYIDPETGKAKSRVHGYTNEIHLVDPKFVVSESGAQQSLDRGQRTVHAKVYGMRGEQPPEPLPYSNFNYDPPFINPDPGTFYHRDNREPIYEADHAHFSPDGQTHAASADNWGRPHQPSVVFPPHPSLNAANPETVKGSGNKPKGRPRRAK